MSQHGLAGCPSLSLSLPLLSPPFYKVSNLSAFSPPTFQETPWLLPLFGEGCVWRGEAKKNSSECVSKALSKAWEGCPDGHPPGALLCASTYPSLHHRATRV
eukprot:TRINITY_DN460_c5_g1_i1.p2 TRINITY_DN460_c5_g1~~TRINITY_DN460_c5_g1_i1.p2  ORF type:complete len:112 (+),score=0.34 TRINITY_DN460_c5_g1_i1:33-338(+)